MGNSAISNKPKDRGASSSSCATTTVTGHATVASICNTLKDQLVQDDEKRRQKHREAGRKYRQLQKQDKEAKKKAEEARRESKRLRQQEYRALHKQNKEAKKKAEEARKERKRDSYRLKQQIYRAKKKEAEAKK